MRVDITKITSAINKIADLTSGDKIIPGVLLNLSRVDGSDTEGKLKVCYSDGHKSLIEELDVIVEEGDKLEGFVVSFETIARAIGNCQPSGIIKVEEVVFQFLANNIVRVSADQSMEIKDNEGNIAGYRKMANKKMDLLWTEPGSDMKSSILTRMKYDDIFTGEIYDTYNKAELIDALTRTSTEKGRQIYISSNVQQIFVANQVHVTAVPVSKAKVLTEEEIDAIRTDLTAKGEFTEEALAKEVANAENRVHQSIVLSQQIAKALIGVLNKTDADEVNVYRQDKYCNIFIDTDTEKLGIWLEMSQASKAHISALEKYNSLNYQSYQLLFVREFLDNNIKSALNATKSEKVQFRFAKTQSDAASSPYDVVIASASSSASISDTYAVNADDVVDPTNTIETLVLNVSLKVISDMLAQLKTNLVAFDINVGEQNTTCIRLAEVNLDEYGKNYGLIRQQVIENAKLANINAGMDSITAEENAQKTPTPAESKMAIRLARGVLMTKQYTLLGKQ